MHSGRILCRFSRRLIWMPESKIDPKSERGGYVASKATAAEAAEMKKREEEGCRKDSRLIAIVNWQWRREMGKRMTALACSPRSAVAASTSRTGIKG